MHRPSYVIVYLLAVAGVFAASMFIPDASGAVADVKFENPADAVLEYLTEMSKLAGTLNAALFAACGALAVKSSDWSGRWSHVDGYLIVLSLVAGATSYYATYLCQIAILEMAYQGAIDPLSTRLSIALGIQYYALLFGVFMVGLVFVRMLGTRKALG